MTPIICKTCNEGTMYKTKIPKFSTPVVWIGRILLVPSILGILITALFAVVSVFGLVGWAAHTGSTEDVAGGIGCAGCLGVFGAITSFVSGLLGWLLIMKKTVLKCNQCGTTISAD